MTWQDISSAPKDGTFILVTDKGFENDYNIIQVRWRGLHWFCDWDGETWDDKSWSHWMPLPDPPEAT